MENLQTDRLILEPLKLHHAKEMFEGYQEIDIYQFIERSPPKSLEWLEEEFSKVVKREFVNKKGERLILFDWAIRLKETGEVIGCAEYTVYPNGECNVAYVLFKKFWRKGLGFEAMKKSFEVMKQNESIKTFIIECDSLNVASIKMAQKLDFTYEKTIFEASELKDRKGHDHRFLFQNR